MRVTFRTLCAGPAGVRQPGSTHDVPDLEGKQLVAGGYAFATDPPPTPTADEGTPSATREALEVEKGETAALPKQPARAQRRSAK